MKEESLILRLSKRELDALRDVLVLDPEHEAMIENAQPDGRGYLLTGSWNAFDDLAGYVAADANHSESQRKQDMLDAIYEKIEELTSG